MKKKSTYRLLVQSEEKSRNVLETALYALFGFAALATIWQFAEQASSLPAQRTVAATEQRLAS